MPDSRESGAVCMMGRLIPLIAFLASALLGLWPRDCIPATTEEKIVTHADNLIAGKTLVTIHETIADAIHLPRKARIRMYRLSCEVELLCDG